MSLLNGKKRIHYNDQNLTLYIYPASYRIADDIFEHMEFALKHEGMNLYILKKVLVKIPSSEIAKYILSRPTGKYARVIWYLYEKWNNLQLSIQDLKQGTYTPLLDPEIYYCGKGTRSIRHRVADNLLGSLEFAPLVRKTVMLKDYETKQIGQMARDLAKQYDPSILARAMRYLYTKETMSSWEIEREKPDHVKLAKFVNLLHKADSIGTLNESTLVELQKGIVDPRFALSTYRNFQNYIGEEPSLEQLIVHYICPKPEDVQFLMNNVIHTFNVMEKSEINL